MTSVVGFSWECPKCTFLNHKTTCEMCEYKYTSIHKENQPSGGGGGATAILKNFFNALYSGELSPMKKKTALRQLDDVYKIDPRTNQSAKKEPLSNKHHQTNKPKSSGNLYNKDGTWTCQTCTYKVFLTVGFSNSFYCK